MDAWVAQWGNGCTWYWRGRGLDGWLGWVRGCTWRGGSRGGRGELVQGVEGLDERLEGGRACPTAALATLAAGAAGAADGGDDGNGDESTRDAFAQCNVLALEQQVHGQGTIAAAFWAHIRVLSIIQVLQDPSASFAWDAVRNGIECLSVGNIRRQSDLSASVSHAQDSCHRLIARHVRQ
eukprot:1158883-Pelagomonas_calceolata.AAC.21